MPEPVEHLGRGVRQCQIDRESLGFSPDRPDFGGHGIQQRRGPGDEYDVVIPRTESREFPANSTGCAGHHGPGHTTVDDTRRSFVAVCWLTYMKPVLLLLALAGGVCAQTRFEYWPGAKYDPAIPTEKAVLGRDPGERLSSHAEIVKYATALAAAAPARMKVFDYAETWEHRKLIYLVIGSEANIKRLSEIQASMKKIADPRKTNDAEAKRIMANL